MRKQMEKEKKTLYPNEGKLDHPRALEDMRDFLQTVPRDILDNYILDLMWKDTSFKESELYRAYLLRMSKDIDIVPKPIARAVISGR
jgi:hypothetical protein